MYKAKQLLGVVSQGLTIGRYNDTESCPPTLIVLDDPRSIQAKQISKGVIEMNLIRLIGKATKAIFVNPPTVIVCVDEELYNAYLKDVSGIEMPSLVLGGRA